MATLGETFELNVACLCKMEVGRGFISPLLRVWMSKSWRFSYWWSQWKPGWCAPELQLSRPDVCMRSSSSFKAVGGVGFCGSQLSGEKRECPKPLHASRDVWTRVDTLARFVATEAKRWVRSASKSSLTKDVEATGMSHARSTEAKQHRACKIVVRRGAGLQVSWT